MAVKTAPSVDLTGVLVNISEVMAKLLEGQNAMLNKLSEAPVAVKTTKTKATKSEKTEKAAEEFLVTPDQVKAISVETWNIFKTLGAKRAEDGSIVRHRNDRGFMVIVQDEKSPINGDDRRWAFGLGKTVAEKGSLTDAQIAPAQRLVSKLLSTKTIKSL